MYTIPNTAMNQQGYKIIRTMPPYENQQATQSGIQSIQQPATHNSNSNGIITSSNDQSMCIMVPQQQAFPTQQQLQLIPILPMQSPISQNVQLFNTGQQLI